MLDSLPALRHRTSTFKHQAPGIHRPLSSVHRPFIFDSSFGAEHPILLMANHRIAVFFGRGSPGANSSALRERREYSEGVNVSKVSSSGKIPGVVLVILVLCVTSGCIYSRIRGTSDRPIQTGMDVFVQAAIQRHLMDSIGLFPFDAPPEMTWVSDKVTTAFQTRMAQRRPFRDVRQVPYPVKSDAEALWYARNGECDLVMVPMVLEIADGSGAMPTRLSVRTRILDARTGMVLWDIKQTALSEPGADIDLVWNTIAGQPAQRLPELADSLARQFTEYLLEPLEEEARRPKISPETF